MTDQGIINLLGKLDKQNPCAKSIRFMKMRSTRVRVNGVQHLFTLAKKLQGVRCSNYDVLQVCT